MRDATWAGETTPESRTSVTRVAVVSDDETVRRATVDHLDATIPDVQVQGFPSGAAFLDAHSGEGETLNCVVADYEMVGMNGLDLLDAVRDVDPELPFIIYTGNGTEDVASEAISAGVTDYVRKSAADGHHILANRVQSAIARRRAEVERDLQALAMATVEEGIAVVDSEGRFVEVNGAYAEMYDYEQRELVGQSWETVNPPDETERMQLQILPALEAEGTWRGESVGLRRDGSTFVESTSMTKLDDGGFVCSVRDVTDQRVAEDALREQNERLREFSRLVSHDLRNPLNVAEGYLTLVEESVDDDVSEEIEHIRTAHNRMRRLIDDMLRLAREGRIVDNPEPVSLADVASAAALTAGLTDDVVVDDFPSVYADEERLSALFENLFGNAIEHAGPDPTVSVGAIDEGHGVCGFFVEDDGPGIPEDHQQKVFHSGFTTDSSGTGFGLAIVKRIVSAHGWTVSVRNGTSGGARFEFRDVDVVSTDAAAEETGSDAVTDGGDDDGADA